MSKKTRRTTTDSGERETGKQEYKRSLRALQVELVTLQRHFIGCGDKILVLLEGRDASGKDGTIKRIVQL
jgi:polyphosphate kinase 2 (PPK2 family)